MSAKKLAVNAKSKVEVLLDNLRRRKDVHFPEQLASAAQYERLLGDDALWNRSLTEPVYINHSVGLWGGNSWYLPSQWLYHDCFWNISGAFTDDQAKLLIMDAFDQERRKFERLAQKLSSDGDTKATRPNIPEVVRIEVWRRNDGACARCGSRERLEYDHIIPIIKGGSNTARNIELLCETCNRKKSDNIQ